VRTARRAGLQNVARICHRASAGACAAGCGLGAGGERCVSAATGASERPVEPDIDGLMCHV